MKLLVLDVCFKESCQLVKVAAWWDEANDGDQSLGVNQLFKRNVVQIQLSGNRHHHAIQLLFAKCSVRSDTQLAAQHDVESLRACTT